MDAHTVAAVALGVFLLAVGASHFAALARCRGHARADPLRGPPGAVARLAINLIYLAWAWWIATCG